MKLAIIDLGTNTFHLLVVETEGHHELFRMSTPARIGQGGINQNKITQEAIERALAVLRNFKDKSDELGVLHENIHAFGTSAIRNADNRAEFLSVVKAQTGITITVIDGDKEAELIYEGVRQAVEVRDHAMIVDIGGGSVEFIICDPEKILWKRSFEIGGQRLIERFMKKDPISPADITRMNDYLTQELLPLANAVHQYHPKALIGSSGSFDTLNDMYFMRTRGHLPPEEVKGFDYPMEEFGRAFDELVFRDKAARMNIPGMIELRVDMIVVAVCLIRLIIQQYGIESIKISNYALKEGALASVLKES